MKNQTLKKLLEKDKMQELTVYIWGFLNSILYIRGKYLLEKCHSTNKLSKETVWKIKNKKEISLFYFLNQFLKKEDLKKNIMELLQIFDQNKYIESLLKIKLLSVYF